MIPTMRTGRSGMPQGVPGMLVHQHPPASTRLAAINGKKAEAMPILSLFTSSLVQNRAFQVSAVSHSFRADVVPPHLLFFEVDS